MRSIFYLPAPDAEQRVGQRTQEDHGVGNPVAPRPVEIPQREHRIRPAFGLPPHAPLPSVSRQSLEQYRAYLAERLAFPFLAEYCEEIDQTDIIDHVVLVLGLLDLPQSLRDSGQGLIAWAEIGGRSVTVRLVDLKADDDSAEQQLIDDYWYWFWNWQ